MQALERLEIQNSTILSVNGFFNKGKTFLLNKLAGFNLPSEFKWATKGMSFKIPKAGSASQNWLLLDTAGTSTPIRNESDAALADKKSTELFLHDMVFELSDVMIVVVNELTWIEQEYIQTLYHRLKNSNKPYRHLYVVHNFMHLREEEDLRKLWLKRVVCCFPGRLIQTPLEPKSKEFGYMWKNAKDDIYHLFLAHDDSPAGKKWNPRTFAHLRALMSDKFVGERAALTQRLCSAVKKFLPEYCKEVEDVSFQFKDQEDGEPGAAAVPDDPRNWGQKSVLPSEGGLDASVVLAITGNTSLSCGCVRYDGYRIVLSGRDDFQPKYDVIHLPEGMLVIVDLPGFSIDKIFTVEDKTLVHVGSDAFNVQGLTSAPREEENEGKGKEKDKEKEAETETDAQESRHYPPNAVVTLLVIEGTRTLFYRSVEQDDTSKLAFQRNPQWYSTTDPGVQRSAGKFRCLIPIAAKYERFHERVGLKDGVLQVFLPVIVTDRGREGVPMGE